MNALREKLHAKNIRRPKSNAVAVLEKRLYTK
jgi:hypothetical protein